MIQVYAGIAIVLTVAGVLKFYPERLTIKKMSLTAILLSVSLLMTLFSISFFFLGGQVVIRFSQLVLILIGASLGPIYAIIAGFGFDVLNLLINPLGAPYLGFTLNNIWVGLFAAIVFRSLKDKNVKLNITLLFTSLIVYAFYIIVVLSLFITRKNLVDIIDGTAYTMIKNALVATLIVFGLIVMAIFIIRSKKIKLTQIPQSLVLLIIASTLVELFVQGFFTPLWLYDMAKTPILVSMQIRAIKGGLMVFLNSFVGFSIYETILKRIVR